MEFLLVIWAAAMCAAAIGWSLMASKPDWREIALTLVVASVPAVLFIGVFWGKIDRIEKGVDALTNEVYLGDTSLKTQTALMKADLEYVRPRIIREDFERELARLNQEISQLRQQVQQLQQQIDTLRKALADAERKTKPGS